MAHAIAARSRSTRWRLGLLIVALTLAWLAVLGPAPAQAWYCSPSGVPPWQHYDHNHYDLFQYWTYESGHTHSNGEHHHIWYLHGGSNAGERHINCGTA